MKTFRIELFYYNRSVKNGVAFGINMSRGIRTTIYRREASLEAALSWVQDLDSSGIIWVREWKVTETNSLGTI